MGAMQKRHGLCDGLELEAGKGTVLNVYELMGRHYSIESVGREFPWKVFTSGLWGELVVRLFLIRGLLKEDALKSCNLHVYWYTYLPFRCIRFAWSSTTLYKFSNFPATISLV